MIAEGGGAFGQAFPDILPIRAAGGHNPTLKNSFDRYQRSRVSPAVNLGVTIRVGNHTAAAVATEREVRPAFPGYIPVEGEYSRGQRVFVLILQAKTETA